MADETDLPRNSADDVHDVAPTDPVGDSTETTAPERSRRRGGAKAAGGGRKKRSKLRVLCYTLLVLMIILALTVGGFAWYLKHIADSDISRQDLLPGGSTSSEKGAQNILLLGSDSRDTSLRDGSRSDVIQLVHVSADRKKLSVVHFPRDLYVDIPGHGKNKINAAYAYGGPKLLVSTLQNVTGVHVDHVAQIGFDGFAKVTDDMGGVDMYVDQPFDEGDYGSWTKGTHHMNGTQARHYVQERHQLKNGDIDRGKNQQEWISAMFKKAKTQGVLANPFTIVKIVKDTSNNLAVDKDFTTSYMTSLATSLRDLDGNAITYYTAPYTGFGMEKAAGSVVYPNMPALKKLGEGLVKDDMSGVPGGHVGSPL